MTVILVCIIACMIASIVLSVSTKSSFTRALPKGVVWGLLFVLFLYLNRSFAEFLELGRGSSGYARGKGVVSPYGALVQFALIAEMFGVYKLFPRLSEVCEAKCIVGERGETSHKQLQSVTEVFAITPLTVFFAFFSVSNVVLGVMMLTNTIYGVIFIIMGLILLIPAYKVSNKLIVKHIS